MTEPIGLFNDFSVAEDRVIIQRPQGSIKQRDLLAAAIGLGKQLSGDKSPIDGSCSGQPSAPSHVINLCGDRYHFIVGFCAALISGQTSLLPSNRQPHTIAQLSARYPNSVLLVDESTDEFGDLNCININATAPMLAKKDLMAQQPMIAADHIAAIVFTSGSSGQPTAIEKPWRTFVGTTRLLARRFVTGGSVAIVATVPPQHMYGLEMTVMMALHGGVIVHSGHPFFPEDIAFALGQTVAPRILVSTPIHLAALVKSEVILAELECVISSTAPLPEGAASDAEKFMGCPVMEIFGCSEAGSLASRRTLSGSEWTLLEGMTIVAQQASGKESLATVFGCHLLANVPLHDRLELIDDSHFRFLGRSSDMLNVAGKRASLADLSHKLQQIDGVDDGVFFLPEKDGQASERPAALVVSALPRRDIVRALAALIDPVFLPRPLKKVASISRNAVGKIPREVLQQLLGRA